MPSKPTFRVLVRLHPGDGELSDPIRDRATYSQHSIQYDLPDALAVLPSLVKSGHKYFCFLVLQMTAGEQVAVFKATYHANE